MRLDKFLQLSRLVKRRAVANALCDRGRVRLNGNPARASAEVRQGDVITIVQGERRLILRMYAATRDHDLKRTGLEKETREHPQDAERRYALGDLLLREGRPRMALPELLAAAGQRPGWKQAWARLADACALLDYDHLRAEAERGAS